jgi:hypothetical protein
MKRCLHGTFFNTFYNLFGYIFSFFATSREVQSLMPSPDARALYWPGNANVLHTFYYSKRPLIKSVPKVELLVIAAVHQVVPYQSTALPFSTTCPDCINEVNMKISVSSIASNCVSVFCKLRCIA